MDGRTRYQRLCRCETVDRPPYAELLGFEPATICRWHREGMPADTHLNAEFALDRVEFVPLDDGPAPAFEPELIGIEGDAVTRRDRLGRAVREVVNQRPSDGGRDPFGEIISYPLRTRADWAAIQRRLDPASPRRYPLYWADYLRCVRVRDYPLGLAVRGPMGRLIDLAGAAQTAALMVEDPAFVCEMLAAFAAFIHDLVRPAIAGIPEMEFIMLREDLAEPALSQKSFDVWLRPHYERLIQMAAKHGDTAVLLICPGDLSAIAGSLAAMGLAGLGPLATESGMEPVTMRLRHGGGGGLALFGGIDARALALTPEAIEREVMEKAPALLKAGGWMPSLDRPVPPDVSLANYRYYWELVRDVVEG